MSENYVCFPSRNTTFYNYKIPQADISIQQVIYVMVTEIVVRYEYTNNTARQVSDAILQFISGNYTIKGNVIPLDFLIIRLK